MAEQRLLIRVYGRVQGVGFREFVRAEAQDIGAIHGWVRNLADGSVEIVAQGEAEPLARLRERAAMGPAWAQVERIEETSAEAAPIEPGFRIRR